MRLQDGRVVAYDAGTGAQRTATWSGMHREGVRRGLGSDGEHVAGDQEDDAGTEREREAQVVQVGKRHITEHPWVRHVAALSHDRDLVVVCRHPPDEPAREVEKHTEGTGEEPDLVRHRRWSVKIGQLEKCREQISREGQHHQRSIGHKTGTDLDSQQEHAYRTDDRKDCGQVRTNPARRTGAAELINCKYLCHTVNLWKLRSLTLKVANYLFE